VRIGDEMVQPEMMLWAELPELLIVGMQVIEPGETPSFAETFEATTKSPVVGKPRRPARVRVSDPALARELQSLEDPPEVVVAPTPELDAIFDEVVESALGAAVPTYSYVAGGSIRPETVRKFFEVATRFRAARPWKILRDDQIFEGCFRLASRDLPAATPL
jgi:hypothetical protein